MNVVLVFLGGGVGCVARYLIGAGIRKTAATLPWATFLSNISSCLVFALVLWLISSKSQDSTNLRLLLLTGFCGGLSTFSAFSFETFLLLKEGFLLYALLNVLLNVTLCLLIFYTFRSSL